MDRETEEKFKYFEKVILTLNKSLQINESKTLSVNDGLKKIHKDFESIEIIARELQENQGSGGSGISSGGGLSDAQAEIIIKKILLEDKELLETFKKIIENVVTFNHDKDAMNGYVEKKNSKKKKSKVPYISLFLGAVVLIFGIGFYFLNEKVTSIVLKPGEVFYDAKEKAQLPLKMDQSVELDVTNESEDKYYFKLNNKEYYVLKDKKK